MLGATPSGRARPTFLLLALGLVATPIGAQLPRRAVARLDSLLDAPPFNRQLWGVALTDDQGRLLFGRNADRLFVPASNTKLVVSAVAAARFDPDWRVKTSVYLAGTLTDGVAHGDLVLYGRGDPAMSNRCYAVDTLPEGACDRDPFGRFRQLARALKAGGLRAVEGDLVGDGSWFDGELVHPSWNTGDLAWWYAAPVSGLGFNDNSVDITWRPGPEVDTPARLWFAPMLGDVTLENRTRTVEPGGESDIGDRMYREPGSLRLWAEGTVALDHGGGLESFAMPDPSLFAARAFRQMLYEEGIAITGTTSSTVDSLLYSRARQDAALAEVESRPVRDWIFPILNTSQNWFAEMLLKQLGRQFGEGGSWPGGVQVERRFLIDSIGVDSTQFAVTDGSGLAANNLVSPLAFTQILRFIRRHPHWDTFAAGLPRSGQVGSLKSRFVGTALEGHVAAKTGSISRVNTLSGFFELPTGKTYTFSVQANHHVIGGRRMLAEIDSVVVGMARAVEAKR
jgi:serine-type D-Ala-D-Ala carboxypeptidase/endopeptidase (penicillin-binding protein 4)